MLDIHAVAVVFSVYVVGVVIPGPNFVAVAHKAASTNTADALAMVAGIVVVNLFWATCSILGVGIVFATFPWIALAVKLAGAAYLIWFGGRLIVKAGGTSTARVDEGGPTVWQSFRAGIATNIANPKSMAFFAAVFAAAAPAHVNPPTFLAMLATVAVVSSTWYALVAVFFATPRVAARYRHWKKGIDRVCGSVIVALGIRQLVR
ncbi:LysE family translocator [Luteibacter aegosomatissinici]|uniref:LysE family translocator n=1 Tax=Luteibacter aegosomatissinici TaxID=2911539 RepID=UPI001FF70AB3|nr:LysE family translocator [Luteibacter aegosomatissinici]UPG94479.1 LysE family translocator [Luteibacter aegosomatissinici]